MKTNPAARRVWKLRLSLAGLAIAALASFNLWAGSYCYHNLANNPMPQTGTPALANGSAIGSGLFLSF